MRAALRAALLLACLLPALPAQPITIAFVPSKTDAAACDDELAACRAYPSAWTTTGTSAFLCACWLDAYRCYRDSNVLPANFLDKCSADCPADPLTLANAVCAPPADAVPLRLDTGGVSGAAAVAPSLAAALVVAAAVAAVAAG